MSAGEQPNAPRRKRIKAPAEDVVAPAPAEKADVAALQALASGTANEAQQRLALDWIVNFAAGTYDEPYRPERPHDTAYACGRRSVGLNIVRLLRLKLGQIED